MKKKLFVASLLMVAFLASCSSVSTSSEQPSSSSEVTTSTTLPSTSSESTSSKVDPSSSSASSMSSSSYVDPLAEKRQAAKDELAKTDLSVYRSEQKLIVEGIIDNANIAINEATTEAEIDSILVEAKADIAEVLTDAQLTEMYTLMDVTFDIYEIPSWAKYNARIAASVYMPDDKLVEYELIDNGWTSYKGQVPQGAKTIQFLRYNSDKTEVWENTDAFAFNKQVPDMMFHFDSDGQQTLIPFKEPARFFVDMKVAVEGGENFAIAYHKSSEGGNDTTDVLTLLEPNSKGKVAPELKDGFDQFKIIRMPELKPGEILSWELIKDGSHYWGGTPEYVTINAEHPYYVIYDRGGDARVYNGFWTNLDTVYTLTINNAQPTFGNVEANVEDLSNIAPGTKVSVVVTPEEGCKLTSFKVNDVDTLLENDMYSYYAMYNTVIDVVFEQKPVIDPTELANRKSLANAELDKIDLDLYREAEKTVVSGFIAEGKSAIEAAVDYDGVDTALASAKAKIAEVFTDAELTEMYTLMDITIDWRNIDYWFNDGAVNKLNVITPDGKTTVADYTQAFGKIGVAKIPQGALTIQMIRYDPEGTSIWNQTDVLAFDKAVPNMVFVTTPKQALVAATTYTVSKSVGDNGSMTLSKEKGILPGETILVSVTPDSGYMVETFKVDDVDTLLTENKYELVVNANTTVAVTFKEVPAVTHVLTLTNNNVSGGSMASDQVNDELIEEGTSVTVTLTPNDGYVISEFTVGGVAQSGDSATFTMNADTTVVGNFAIKLPKLLKIDLEGTGLISGGEEIHVKLIGPSGSKWVKATMHQCLAYVDVVGDYTSFIIQRTEIGQPLEDGVADWGHSLEIPAALGDNVFVTTFADGLIQGTYQVERILTIDFSQSEGIITGPGYELLAAYCYNTSSGINEWQIINVDFTNRVGTVKIPYGMTNIKIIRMAPTTEPITWEYVNTHFWGGNVEIPAVYNCAEAYITNGYTLIAKKLAVTFDPSVAASQVTGGEMFGFYFYNSEGANEWVKATRIDNTLYVTVPLNSYTHFKILRTSISEEPFDWTMPWWGGLDETALTCDAAYLIISMDVGGHYTAQVVAR